MVCTLSIEILGRAGDVVDRVLDLDDFADHFRQRLVAGLDALEAGAGVVNGLDFAGRERAVENRRLIYHPKEGPATRVATRANRNRGTARAGRVVERIGTG